MAGIFTDGVAKVRPGTYFNVSTNDGTGVVGAQDGIVAVLFGGTFGPLNQVRELADTSEIYPIYGNGGNVDGVELAFLGGARKVLAVRVGTGGTGASTKLGEIATITAKYPGSRAFSVTVRDSLVTPGAKVVSIYAGNKEMEHYEFPKNGTTEGAALRKAMEQSAGFTVEVNTDGALADVSQQVFTGGTDPVVDVDSYQTGLEQLENIYCNGVCVATGEPGVHLLLKSFLERAYENGFFACGVVAEDPGTNLDTRMEHGKMLNDEKMIYVLNAKAMRMEKELKGYQIAAMVAGMYAAYPSSQSLTHKVLKEVSELTDVLKPSEIDKAESQGCLVLSKSRDGKIWIDNGINTLSELPENKDMGWKKIRRTKTRFELMHRMNTTADNLTGYVDNDKNGRETMISKLKEVGTAMIQEGKLVSCNVTEYPGKEANGDYAYFLIDPVDKDSLEHLYLYYNFTYNTNEEG